MTTRRLRSGLNEPAWAILISVFVLYIIGLLCIYATEVSQAGTPTNTVKQVVHLLVGGVGALIILRIGYAWFARHAFAITALAVLALVPLVLAQFVSFGSLIEDRRGAYRWINLGIYSLQPSEFMKVAYIVGLAAYLRYRRNYRTFAGLLVPLLASLVPMLLILLEPDLGTVILMIPVLFVMLYAAGAKAKHLALVGLVGVCVSPLLWHGMAPYQRSRILGVLLQSERLRAKIIEEPEKYAFLATKQQAKGWTFNSGMQITRSKAAVGSGNITGNGWAGGTYVEYNFLPDKHNDFIFAIIGHQWGLVGCLVVLACYTVIILAGVEIAAGTTDPFARLLCVGVIALIATQASINVGMTIGLMPITGMTLPFVSYGGSSLLVNFLAVGLLISVSRRRPFLLASRPFEYGATRADSSAGRLAVLGAIRHASRLDD